MKRDKKQQHHIHTHHTGGGGGGGHHSPPYSPDAANASSQHFFPADSGTSGGSGGSGGTHKTSTTTAPSTTMTVSELLRSFGPSAYLSHDLLLGVASVLALFFHTALHHLLYTLVSVLSVIFPFIPDLLDHFPSDDFLLHLRIGII